MTITEKDLKGLVFNIQKFSIHDGNGIRTLIFMKGCPLKCKWCSNPESQSCVREIMFLCEKCIGCGNCVKICPNHCIDSFSFLIDRSKCDACGNCATVCYSNAKKMVGEWKTAHEVMQEIEKDRIFYYNSDGGVTIGGGEPTVQFKFVTDLLKECRSAHLHTAMETCGYVSWDRAEETFHYLDQVFFDLKHMNYNKHIQLTGVGNEMILENAKRLAVLDKDIIFRVPLIPGCNDDEENIKRTGEFVGALTRDRNIKIELIQYHSLGENKYRGLDRKYPLSGIKAERDDRSSQYHKLLTDLGCFVIE